MEETFMLSARDISGLMAMMPAFATDDAADYRQTSTIAVDKMRAGLDRMLGDGANVISTTGSFGEFHTLLIDEFRTLAHEAAKIVNKRAPLFIGVTSINTREVMEKCRIVSQTGADGILVGVPFYFPSTVDNAVRFFKDVGEAFPKLNIMIYHNPALHNVKIPVEAFKRITENSAVVAMKDSHRTPEEFQQLMGIIRGKISVMVNQNQFAEYAGYGAPGFWSIDAWMGPWPQIALREAIRAGDVALAHAITADLRAQREAGAPNLSWRETASKIGVRLAGYVDPGPLRPPFVEIPDDIVEKQRARVAYWKTLCAKYQPKLAAE